MKKFLLFTTLITLLSCNSSIENNLINVEISIHQSLGSEEYDGRLLLLFSTNEEKEPRFQIGEGLSNQLVFGKNVSKFNSENTKDTFRF